MRLSSYMLSPMNKWFGWYTCLKPHGMAWWHSSRSRYTLRFGCHGSLRAVCSAACTGSRPLRLTLYTLRRWGVTWCYIRRFARDLCEESNIGGEVRHGVTSGVACETCLNKHVTPRLQKEYMLVCFAACTGSRPLQLTLYVMNAAVLVRYILNLTASLCASLLSCSSYGLPVKVNALLHTQKLYI